MSQNKFNPFEIARNHLARATGKTSEVIGPADEELRNQRLKFIEEVSSWDQKKKDQVIANLTKRVERLENSGNGGSSELRWKISVLLLE